MDRRKLREKHSSQGAKIKQNEENKENLTLE